MVLKTISPGCGVRVSLVLFLSPTCQDYDTHLCMHACACVRLSQFYINLCISFIYEDIFTKLAENVYGGENVCKKFCTHF